MTINERIKLIIDRSGKSQKEAASWFGFSPGRLSQKLKEGIWDSLNELEQISNHTGYSLEWILTGEPSEPTKSTAEKEIAKLHTYIKNEEKLQEGILKAEQKLSKVHEQDPSYLLGRNIRLVTVTVDRSGKDLMVYVPVKAQAGYLAGHGDPHYIEKLPAFSLPILKSGQYRMFEVDGESMLQLGGGGLHDGDIVISQYVEDIFSMRDNRVYVVISTEGVNVKRCLNRLTEKENPILVLKSDNKKPGQFPDIILRPHQIIEVWELKAFISKQLGFATDLWKIVGDLEAQMALMNEKINRISDEKLLPG